MHPPTDPPTDTFHAPERSIHHPAPSTNQNPYSSIHQAYARSSIHQAYARYMHDNTPHPLPISHEGQLLGVGVAAAPRPPSQTGCSRAPTRRLRRRADQGRRRADQGLGTSTLATRSPGSPAQKNKKPGHASVVHHMQFRAHHRVQRYVNEAPSMRGAHLGAGSANIAFWVRWARRPSPAPRTLEAPVTRC
jgi:hypothetical protein